jgi:hypothetical protein
MSPCIRDRWEQRIKKSLYKELEHTVEDQLKVPQFKVFSHSTFSFIDPKSITSTLSFILFVLNLVLKSNQEHVDCINLAQDRNKWQTLENRVIE